MWLTPFFFLNTALLGLLSLLVSLWSARGARKFGLTWARVNLKASGVKLVVSGLENLPQDQGGFILAANHRSAADIFTMLSAFDLDLCWVAKASLLKIPVLGWHLKRVHIPVARRAAGNTRKFMQDGANKIREGAHVIIFPEGTRNATGQKLLPFRKGTFLLAQASGRPIVPVAISGSDKIWPPNRPLPGLGTIHLRVGPVIDPGRYQPDELDQLAEETHQVILSMIAD